MEFDLVVVGSGAGGLAAAVTAASLGLSVIVLEKHRQVGGTTAWSGGWMWIPRNPLAVEAGIVEPIEGPRTYLKHELGNAYDGRFVDALLEHGPRMVDFFRRRTSVQFIAGNTIPDFHVGPGAGSGGRSVCAAPFDGRALGPRIALLRPPLDLASPFGMAIASGADMQRFFDWRRSATALRHVVGRLARHVRDRVRHGRGMRLVNGNALVARLLKSADDLGVTIRVGAAATRLLQDGARVTGVIANGEPIAARCGVVLATGGFPHDHARQADLFGHGPHHSAAPPENTGDGLHLGESAGGSVRRDLSDAGAWAPVSLVTRPDGSVGHFPHLVERAKPGLIMVTRDGRRFCNEADSYHDVMRALFAASPAGEAWLLCDHRFVRRYGLGRVRPAPFALRPWLRQGYLRRGATIAALASACGIDDARLAATIAGYNADAVSGRDPAFGRGTTPYNRIQGEAAHGPNPCVAPIVQAPFYAVRVVAGSLGTFAGLRTDAQARVLDGAGAAIAGLYAVGNDMSSMMGGRYPAGGITLGPAMTFGFICAHHAAGVALTESEGSCDTT